MHTCTNVLDAQSVECIAWYLLECDYQGVIQAIRWIVIYARVCLMLWRCDDLSQHKCDRHARISLVNTITILWYGCKRCQHQRIWQAWYLCHVRVVFVTVFFIFSVFVTVFVIIFVMFLSQKNISAGTLQAEEYLAEKSVWVSSWKELQVPQVSQQLLRLVILWRDILSSRAVKYNRRASQQTQLLQRFSRRVSQQRCNIKNRKVSKVSQIQQKNITADMKLR